MFSAARHAVAPEKTRPLDDCGEDVVDLLQLGDEPHALAHPLVGELDDRVTVDGHLARWQVAHPVVGEERPHDADVPGGEGPHVVTGDEAAVGLGDEVDLVLRVGTPPADLTGEVVGERTERVLRVRWDHLSARGSWVGTLHRASSGGARPPSGWESPRASAAACPSTDTKSSPPSARSVVQSRLRPQCAARTLRREEARSDERNGKVSKDWRRRHCPVGRPAATLTTSRHCGQDQVSPPRPTRRRDEVNRRLTYQRS